MYQRLTIFILTSLALAAVLAGCARNPATGDTDLIVMTQGKEVSIGQEMHDELIAKGASYDDPELQAYVGQQ